MQKVLKNLKPQLVLQINGYTCGVAALKNALIVHDVRASLHRLARLSKTTKKKGADEFKLRMAARKIGFDLWPYVSRSSELTKENIRAVLRCKTPCLVTVDRWTHWIAVVRCNKRHVWIADSSRPGPVLQRWTWLHFLSRMAVWMREGENRWDTYALVKMS